jgi:hypothetical protein
MGMVPRSLWERITINSLLNKIHGVARGSSRVCGVGRGTTARVSLVPLFAFGMRLMTVTPSMGFGWFVSWISSVAILDLIAKKGITTRGIAALRRGRRPGPPRRWAWGVIAIFHLNRWPVRG